MSYIETWDETKPAGSRDANLGDDDIREFKRAIRERLAGGGMYFPSTDDADAGQFNFVKFKEQSSSPSSAANTGHLFTKDVSGVTELYWMDSAGTEIQLTSGGKIRVEALVIASQAQGDLLYASSASLLARLAKGTASQQLRMNAGATAPEWFTPATVNSVPSGALFMWGTATAPTGYLKCDGSAVSRSTYSDLFAVIGTTFGSGDGSTTFNLPNFTNRFPYGASTGSSGGNADVGSAKDQTLTGNDSSVVFSSGTDQKQDGGGTCTPQNRDMMAPYLAVYFIIKT